MPATNVPTSSYYATHRTRIEERLGNAIMALLPAADPVWRDTIVSSQGVVSQGALTRDYLVHKLYWGSLTGVVQSGWPQADWPLYGDNTQVNFGARSYTASPSQVFPDPANGANPRPFRLSVPLRTMVGNLMLTTEEMDADLLDSAVGEFVAQKEMGFARNWVQQLNHYWYADPANNYRLSTLGPSSGSGAYTVGNSTARTITFYPPNQAIDRYYVGQAVDIFSDATTRKNEKTSVRVKVFVSSVDPIENQVILQVDTTTTDVPGNMTNAEYDTAFVTATPLGESAFIVPANSYRSGGSPTFAGIAGMNAWCKNSGNLLGSEAITGQADPALGGNIDVDTHPEFKSFIKAISGPLTEQGLRKYLDGFYRAGRRFGHFIDTLISTSGVWRAYEEQKIGREYLDRTGRLTSLNNEGSETGFSFTHEGRTYKGFSSEYCESGELYGIRKQGNWKVMTPPGKNRGRMSQIPSFLPVEFVAPSLTGGSANFLPYRPQGNAVTVGYTNAVEMPCWLRMQLMPWEQVRMLKLTGLTESVSYGD